MTGLELPAERRLCYAFSIIIYLSVQMRLAWILVGIFLALSTPARADTAQDIFVNARDAYKAHNELALALDAQQLQAQNYVLAPYADYWLILLRLSQTDNTAMQTFLNRYADLPFTDRVRTEWLKQLGKRQDWQTFFDELPRLQKEDTAVTCYALEGRSQQGDNSGLEEGKELWLSTVDQPDNCNAVFDRMLKTDVLKADDIWARFRLALQDGKVALAKSTIQHLPKFEITSLKLLDRVNDNPQHALDKKIISAKTRYGRELNMYAVERLSRSQPDTALAAWKKLEPDFDVDSRSYLWGRLALYAARRHEPTALDWYTRAGDTSLDNEQLAWKARAAMRALNWPKVQSVIADMPPDMQDQSVWRYWKARALKEQKQIPAANAILVQLAQERSYYGLLGQEELGEAISEPPEFYKASDDEVKAIQNMPAIQRALELQRVDLRWESRTEWSWAIRNFDDKQLIAAAELASRQEWYDLAIITADKTTLTHDFTLRYPTPYRDTMKAYAREQNLDEAWVYGLIRQESRFISNAKSGVGASGLMQVMPATAKWIAKRLGLGAYKHSMIDQLDTNIQLGTYYMRHVLDEMGGQALLATAAYNAGPGRARRWAADQPLEGAIYAETIPFAETRNYVQKVMGNAYFYANRLGLKLQSLKQRLGRVAGTAVTISNAEPSGDALNGEEKEQQPQ